MQDHPHYIFETKEEALAAEEAFLAGVMEKVTAKAEPTGGVKFDQGKPRMDLIAPELLEEVGKVLAYGAEKYGVRNWELGMDWGRPYAAALRHMNAWQRGEDVDPETGLSHMAHAACNLMMLLAFRERGVGTDSRMVVPKV